MTVTEAPALYEAALRGEPLQQTVFPALINTTRPFWTIGQWPIEVPSPSPQTIPRLQRVIREVRGRTGWSARRLADVVGSTHTTIRQAENGRPLMSGHSGDLRQRLLGLHDIVERVYILAGNDPERTATILLTGPASTGRSAIDELRATGDPGRAYVAALDVLRPRSTGLLVGDRPRRDEPTTALHE